MDLDPYLTLYTKNVQTDLKENNIKTKPQEGYLKTHIVLYKCSKFHFKTRNHKQNNQQFGYIKFLKILHNQNKSHITY